MKRDRFIKTLVALTGGLTVVGCSPDLIDEMAALDGTPGDLDIGEAEKWFNDEYLSGFSHPQNERRGKTHRRNAAWKRAQKPKNNKNKEFGWVWVPLDYGGRDRPGVIMYDEDTRYRLELGKYFLQPIIEGIIVMKVGRENKAFLAQIAYDPFELAANGYKLEKATFTGTLLRADWDDNLIDGTVFEKGKMVRGFTNPANAAANPAKPAMENARTANCQFYAVEYTSWYIDTDGVFTLVGHTRWTVHCDESGNGGWGYGGSGGYVGSGGNGTGGGGAIPQSGSGSDAYYDPLVHSGDGTSGGFYPPSALYDFNLERAIAASGTDRRNMNVNLRKTMFASELSVNITTWSYAKADALARAAGLNLREAFPLVYSGVRRVGIASAFFNAGKAVFIIKEGGDNLTTEDMVLLAGGVIVGIGAAVTTGWIAVIFGGISLGILIYDETN